MIGALVRGGACVAGSGWHGAGPARRAGRGARAERRAGGQGIGKVWVVESARARGLVEKEGRARCGGAGGEAGGEANGRAGEARGRAAGMGQARASRARAAQGSTERALAIEESNRGRSAVVD